jgi:hypothetical protein
MVVIITEGFQIEEQFINFLIYKHGGYIYYTHIVGMSDFMDRIARFLNRENPTVRKARNITRRRIDPLKNVLRHRTGTMSPPARLRLTGRPYIAKGAEKNRLTLRFAIASNQANRLEAAREQSAKKTPKKRSSTRRAMSR